MLLAALIGFVAGLAYYVGLWWTIRKVVTARQPKMLLTASFLVRVTLLMLVFILVMQDDWLRLVFCLMGFVLARFVTVRRFTMDTEG